MEKTRPGGRWYDESKRAQVVSMAKLVRVSFEAVREAALRVLPRYPQVAAAIFFGSALGDCRPDSDLDIALVPFPETIQTAGWGPEWVGQAERELGSLGRHPFHLTLLDRRQPIFSFRVLKEGRLVYVRDEDALYSFVERVARLYGEWAPRYQRALQEAVGKA